MTSELHEPAPRTRRGTAAIYLGVTAIAATLALVVTAWPDGHVPTVAMVTTIVLAALAMVLSLTADRT